MYPTSKLHLNKEICTPLSAYLNFSIENLKNNFHGSATGSLRQTFSDLQSFNNQVKTGNQGLKLVSRNLPKGEIEWPHGVIQAIGKIEKLYKAERYAYSSNQRIFSFAFDAHVSQLNIKYPNSYFDILNRMKIVKSVESIYIYQTHLDGQLAASAIFIADLENKSAYFWSNTFVASFKKVSVGISNLEFSIRSLEKLDIKTIDLGSAAHKYKFPLATNYYIALTKYDYLSEIANNLREKLRGKR